MPTTSLFSPFRRINTGAASAAEVRALLWRHDTAPMSLRRFTGVLQAGEWFELDELAARAMAGLFLASLRPGGLTVLPGQRPEQIRSVLFSLVTSDGERWFHGFVSVTDPAVTPEAMRAAIVARESGEPVPDIRQELLERIWNAAGSRQLDAALCCWEAMQDYRILFEHDKPLVRNIHALMLLWTQLGSIELRRWARPAAIYALQIHDHLGQELIDRLVPFDYGFIPAVLEVLEWTENGPDFATTLEDAAARVLQKLELQEGGRQ